MFAKSFVTQPSVFQLPNLCCYCLFTCSLSFRGLVSLYLLKSSFSVILVGLLGSTKTDVCVYSHCIRILTVEYHTVKCKNDVNCNTLIAPRFNPKWIQKILRVQLVGLYPAEIRIVSNSVFLFTEVIKNVGIRVS